jgi:hypothetical protein
MGRNNEDFFAGRNFQEPEEGAVYFHGTNERLNVGDTINPTESLLQSGRHGGAYGIEDVKEDPRATQPRAWAVPVVKGQVTSGNARHALSYAVRREQNFKRTLGKRAYLYQVEPLSPAEKFPSVEN